MTIRYDLQNEVREEEILEMTICDLVTSIGRRLLSCHLRLAIFTFLSLVLCLISQWFYLLFVQIASYVSEPWLAYSFHIFRTILFVFSATVFFVSFAFLEYGLFRGAHEDIDQYFDCGN